MNEPVHDSVMRAIREGRVRMRPRWHFLALSVVIAVALAILALALMYAIGLFLFLLHESGAWFAPSFGARGWGVLMHSIPWSTIILFVALIVLLEYLARRYRFVYRRPLAISALGVAGIIVIGGFLIEPLHHRIRSGSDMLPSPLGGLYRPPFHLRDPRVMRGTIVSGDADRFVIVAGDGATSSVVITARTRLPLGEDFQPGDTVVVMGIKNASGTVEAFGVREVDEDR